MQSEPRNTPIFPYLIKKRSITSQTKIRKNNELWLSYKVNSQCLGEVCDNCFFSDLQINIDEFIEDIMLEEVALAFQRAEEEKKEWEPCMMVINIFVGIFLGILLVLGYSLVSLFIDIVQYYFVPLECSCPTEFD